MKNRRKLPSRLCALLLAMALGKILLADGKHRYHRQNAGRNHIFFDAQRIASER